MNTNNRPEKERPSTQAIPLTGNWITECAACGKHYQNGCGSTECCGAIQYLIDPESGIAGLRELNTGARPDNALRDRPAHDLKTWPLYFAAIAEGRKTFEARFADRDFRVGDTLILREWVPNSNVYTGREVRKTITYILAGPGFGVEAGYCILALGQDIKLMDADAAKSEGGRP